MIRLIKTIAKIIGAIVIVALLIWGLSYTNWGKVSDFARDIRATVVEYFAPEIATAQEAVNKQVISVLQQNGYDTTEVEKILEGYDLSDVETTSLPSDAVEQTTISDTVMGYDVGITIYEDSSYVTVDVDGHTVTIRVPEDLRQYIALLG